MNKTRFHRSKRLPNTAEAPEAEVCVTTASSSQTVQIVHPAIAQLARQMARQSARELFGAALLSQPDPTAALSEAGSSPQAILKENPK